MTDQNCVVFLQWALPQLHLRWRGFRRVRGQVCKRIQRRIAALGLASFGEYREYLEHTEAEWEVLDSLCRITISRFYRDRPLMDHLRRDVLPRLCNALESRGETELVIWSIGAASGEEPYTLAMIWDAECIRSHPSLALRIIATDANGQVLERLEEAIYPGSSLRDLPPAWKEKFFSTEDGRDFQLNRRLKEHVERCLLDIRHALPAPTPRLILCRNLAFTYFDEELQHTTAARLAKRLAPGGYLVLGHHEEIPGIEKLPLVPTDNPMVYQIIS